MHSTLHKFVALAVKDREIEQKGLFGEGKKTKKENHFPSLKELMEIYDKEWSDDWYESEEIKKEFYNKGKKSLKLFYENLKEKGLNLIFINDEPALEKTFSLKLNGDYFIGAIDRIDDLGNGFVEIIDYKTGNPKKTAGKEEKLQLLIYQLALEKVFGIKAEKLTYYYLEDGSCLSFSSKEKEMEKIEQELKEAISRIKRSNFKPTPGWQCNYCDFKDICAHRKF